MTHSQTGSSVVGKEHLVEKASTKCNHSPDSPEQVYADPWDHDGEDPDEAAKGCFCLKFPNRYGESTVRARNT